MQLTQFKCVFLIIQFIADCIEYVGKGNIFG